MLKRCLLYLLLGLSLSSLVVALFHPQVSGWILKWFFVQGLEKSFGIQIKVEELQGGILEDPHLKRVHLSWPQRVFLNSLRAKQATINLNLFDFWTREKSSYFAYLEAVLLKLRPSFKIKFPRPLSLVGEKLVFEEPDALRIRLNREGLVLENLQEAFFYLHRIFFQSLQNQGERSHTFFSQTPKKGHRNQIFVAYSEGSVRVVLSDYSLTEFSSLIPRAKILEGVLNGDISWDGQNLKKMSLDVQDLKIAFDSGRVISGSLDCLYDEGRFEIRRFRSEVLNIICDVKGEIKNLLTDPEVDLKSKLDFENGIFECELKGLLNSLQVKGVYRKQDAQTNQVQDLLRWDLRSKKLYLDEEGLYVEGADGHCILAQSSHPLRVQGDFIIGRRGVIIRRGILEDVIETDGRVQLFQEPSCSLRFSIRKRAFQVQGYPFLLKNFAASLSGPFEDLVLQGSGMIRGFEVDSRFNVSLNHQIWTVGLEYIRQAEVSNFPPFSTQFVVDPRQDKVFIKFFRFGEWVELDGEIELEKMSNLLHWFYASDFESDGAWNAKAFIRALRLGPFHLGASLDLKGRYEVLNRRLSWKSTLRLQDFSLNGTQLPVGKSILWYDPKLKIMQLDGLPLGKEYLLKGSYDLKQKNIDFTLDFFDAELADLELKFKGGQDLFLEGKIKGQVHLTGDPDYPRWDGRLHVKEGRLYDLKCEEAFFYLNGFGSQIDLKNSRLTTSSGRWIISGSLDLSKIHPFKNLNFSMDPQYMGMEGLAIKEDKDFRELTFHKQIDKKFAVSLKARPALEESWMTEGDSETEVQMEYEYQPHQDVLFRMDENEQMFGIRRKMEF